jgi:hypothetical protein
LDFGYVLRSGTGQKMHLDNSGSPERPVPGCFYGSNG